MTRETSIEAYKAIIDSMAPGLRQDICSCLANAGQPMTSYEIAKQMGCPRDSISPRMPELITRDLIKECGEKECLVTGMKQISFFLTGHCEQSPRKILREVRLRKSIQEMLDHTLELMKDPRFPASSPGYSYLNGIARALSWSIGGKTSPTEEYDS